VALEALDHVGGNQPAYVAAKAEDFLDHARAYEGVSSGRLEEDCLDFGGETAVHQRHLELVLVVGDGADAAQDGHGADLAGEIHHEPVECGYRDVSQVTRRFVQHLRPLGDGEERVLDGIAENRNGQVLKKLGAARDQIQMTVGGRVEGAGIDRFYAQRQLTETTLWILAARLAAAMRCVRRRGDCFWRLISGPKGGVAYLR